MTTDDAVTLADYAAANQIRNRCFLCMMDADIEEQAVRGKASGVTYRIMAEWLHSLGYDGATKGRLERHFQERHVHPSRRDDA